MLTPNKMSRPKFDPTSRSSVIGNLEYWLEALKMESEVAPTDHVAHLDCLIHIREVAADAAEKLKPLALKNKTRRVKE